MFSLSVIYLLGKTCADRMGKSLPASSLRDDPKWAWILYENIKGHSLGSQTCKQTPPTRRARSLVHGSLAWLRQVLSIELIILLFFSFIIAIIFLSILIEV